MPAWALFDRYTSSCLCSRAFLAVETVNRDVHEFVCELYAYTDGLTGRLLITVGGGNTVKSPGVLNPRHTGTTVHGSAQCEMVGISRTGRTMNHPHIVER